MTRKALFGTLAFAALLAIVPIDAEAQCWACTKWTVTGVEPEQCDQILGDGYYECTMTAGGCSGVLPRCFGGGASRDAVGPDGAIDRDIEGWLHLASASWSATLGGTAGVLRMMDDSGSLRRSCDGAVLARYYTPDRLTEMRSRSAVMHL